MAKGKYEKWLKPENLILLEGWARDGLTDDQIAHNMGIHRDTLNEWKKRYSDISDALKKGKEVVDLMVENALLKKALGFSVEEKRIEILPDGTKKAVMITKPIPPDTTAQIFWLKNRRPDKWKDKPVYAEQVEYEDDGLIEALSASAKDDWSDGDDSGSI